MKESEEELLHQNNTEQYQDLGVMAHKSIQPPLMDDRGSVSSVLSLQQQEGGEAESPPTLSNHDSLEPGIKVQSNGITMGNHEHRKPEQ